MKKLVVFDWNGTLLLDVNECMRGDNEVLKAFGGRQVDLETYQGTIRIPAIDFYVEHGCSREEIIANQQKTSDIFFKKYKELADQTTLREGTEDLLQWLQANGIEAVILSNHSPEGIRHHLDRFGIGKYFSDVLADVGDSSLMKQAKGERLQRYFQKRGFRPSDAVIIGDTVEETKIGKELGMSTVAMTGGYFSESRLKAGLPDFIVHGLDEFQRILEAQ